jgi:DNA-binding transcriptional LysR family regulator
MYFILSINWSDVIMMPHLDVDQLKTFLAIVDSGSFTRAAEEVNKTQSAVSMQMKRLEEQLGRPLFSKDGRGTKFTRDGERLIDYARRIVALSDEAVSAFTKPDITGTVRFGTPDDYAEFFLPVILGRFARTHPQVTVDVECVPSSELMGRTARGEMQGRKHRRYSPGRTGVDHIIAPRRPRTSRHSHRRCPERLQLARHDDGCFGQHPPPLPRRLCQPQRLHDQRRRRPRPRRRRHARNLHAARHADFDRGRWLSETGHIRYWAGV